jgi:phage gp29-like protein
MMDWCERTVSKVILGATLTSQADGKTSTNALGNVHNDVRHDILVADARQLEGFFRNMIDMLLRINGYEVSRRRLPKLVFDTRDLRKLRHFHWREKPGRVRHEQYPGSWVHKKSASRSPER